MKVRTAFLLAAIPLIGLAVAAYAQGVFDPASQLPEASDQDNLADEPIQRDQGEPGEIVYESYEVVQPIPDEPGPAARTIEPPEDVAEEWVEAERAPEPAAEPAHNGKLIKLERIAQAPAASPAPDKRVRIRQ